MYHYSLSYATIGNLEHLKLIFLKLATNKGPSKCINAYEKSLLVLLSKSRV